VSRRRHHVLDAEDCAPPRQPTGKRVDVQALAPVVERALDGDGAAEELLRALLGARWRRLVVADPRS
jgi:hypothetical protein